MANAKEIKRRIRSVRNVAQITRALQLVASSKLRRTQDRVLAARPYSDELQRILSRLSLARAEQDEPNPWGGSNDREEVDLRLLQDRPIQKIGVVLVTPDKTLSGALSSNTNRKALQFVADLRRERNEPNLPVQFLAIGRRGRDFLLRNRLPLLAEFTNLGDTPDLTTIRAIARVISDAYLAGDVDAWYLVYPKFVSSLTQLPTEIELLPIKAPEKSGQTEEKAVDYIFEPNAETIFASLLPRYLETLIYQPILESVASFYAAQFVAMKNATDNASDLAADLSLTYNKARQSAITTQILEVISGANASE